MYGLEFIACLGQLLQDGALMSFDLFYAYCSIASHAQKLTS